MRRVARVRFPVRARTTHRNTVTRKGMHAMGNHSTPTSNHVCTKCGARFGSAVALAGHKLVRGH